MTPKEAVRAYVEAFNQGDWRRMRELFTADGQVAGVLGAAPLERAIDVWRELQGGMSMRLEIEALVEEGACVAARLRERGRFVGQFRGLPDLEPTGRTYELLAMEWFEFSEGRIARRWGARDAASMRTQVTGG